MPALSQQSSLALDSIKEAEYVLHAVWRGDKTFIKGIELSRSIVNPLDLDSPHHAYPRVMVLEVFWGVFEQYTSPRALAEVFGRSLFSGLLSRHQPDQVPMTPRAPQACLPGCVLAL